jgi:ATP-dependent DNA helicase RecG
MEIFVLRLFDGPGKFVWNFCPCKKIVLHVQANETITNSQVQKLCDVSKATATRYLNDLENHLIEKVGTTGVGTLYVLKGLSKASL